jgi:hypothetical protein
VAASGGGKLLRDTTAKVTDFDAFGNVLTEELSTVGVDLTLQIDRTFKNDTERWVLGQLQTQKECSAAAMQSQCRTLTRTTTIYGEVETEAIETDDGSPETKLTVTYGRDRFGNIVTITAEDAFKHHRFSTITYEPEGIFPFKHVNGAGHTSFTEFDPGLGVLTKHTDPNELVTEWVHDGFGRLGLEKRPDGTQTSITLARTKDGGPEKKAWRVTQRTTTSGGQDAEVEYDSLGRPIRWWWHGPTPPRPGGEPPRLMQEVAYDPRSGQVARRSVPVSEGHGREPNALRCVRVRRAEPRGAAHDALERGHEDGLRRLAREGHRRARERDAHRARSAGSSGRHHRRGEGRDLVSVRALSGRSTR